MVRIIEGDVNVKLEGIKTPETDNEAANKAYVDDNVGGTITASGGLQRVEDDISIADAGINEVKLNVTNTPTAGQILTAATNTTQFTWVNASEGEAITASGGLQRIEDDISIATGGVDTVQLAAGAVDTNRLEDDAVSEAKIADLAVKERHLDVTNSPTAGQVLTSATDTTQFTWADAGGGRDTDYNDAPFGNFDEDGSITWTYNATDDPSSEGEVSFTDNGVQGYTLRFRTADVDTINSVSVNFFQIGFGSPIAFATYAVADLTIANDFVDVSIINGPLDGDDILATFPADNTALSIIVSVSQFRLPLSSLEDVNIPTPVGTHGLIYDGTENEWVSSETVNQIADGGHIDVSTTAGVATLTFDERYDLWNGKSDWMQITSGTPSGDNFLYDEGTQTITVPSLAGREVLEILLDARSGMAVHIRQENTTSDPSGFQSGFYQILSINATETPEQVVIRMLPDASDIFDEIEGNTYQYELSILQFVTGGTLDNLTITGLSDVDVSTPPTDGQVLAFETSSGTFIPANNSGGGGQPASDYNNAVYGALRNPNVSYTYTTETSPVNEGEVSISTVDSPDTGYSLLFRKADVDAQFLQSLRYLQIGFGSPITFATYAVSTTTITDVVDPQLVTITVIDGPLAGNDLLASLPADDTALSINVSSNEFVNPDLGDLPDVDLSTDPTDGQVLAYELSTDTWKAANAGSGGGGDIGDLDDVETGGVQDGFVLRYDGDDSTWKDHSISNTLATYGGVSLDQDGDFSAPTSSGDNSIAIGDNATASASEATSIGAGTEATFASSSAFGHSSRAVHTNSTAIGTGAITTEVDEVRLGDANAHTTVNPSVAGNESDDNQLVSKRWVNNQISDASRVISSTANALENLTIVTASTPWDDYRIVPVDSLDDPSLEVHMYEFDATQPQFIFYAGFLSNSGFGTGAGLTTGTIPDFFEEVTDIANEAEVTNADGEGVTSLGWKYLGHDLATVWQAVSHVYTFNFDWIYPAGNTDGTQNPPDVTSSLELVRLKPTGTDAYNMATNATVIASSPTSFHNAGSLEPGNTETFTGSYEFAQQTLEDGISNVANGDVFAYRMKIRYKGNGFDGETNVRLAITESETTNFVPQLGIRHVGRDYSLVLEDSGDLQWTDHGSVDQSSILLLENTDDGIEIPAATLGLVAGNNITITGKTIASTDSQVLTAGDGIDIASDAISIDFRTETNNPLEVSGTGDAAGLSLNVDEDGPLAKTTNGLDVTIETNGGLAIGSLTSGIEVLLPANSGLQTSATGLSLNADLDELNDVSETAPTDGQVLTWDNGNTTWAPANAQGGASTINDLNDVTITGTPTDGQILEYDNATSMWVNTTLSGNHSFTAGTGLAFNSDSTVLNVDANIFDFSRIGDDTGDNGPNVVAGSTRFIALGVNNSVGGASSISIGSSSQALQTNTIAIGAAARAEAVVATAVGGGSRAMASDASAFGRSAMATGVRSTAIGDTTIASGNGSIALGSEANATAADASSVGFSSLASGARATALGRNTTASGTDSLAVGSSASSGGTNSISIGLGTTSTGDRSVTIGSAAVGSDNALGIAIGERATIGAVRGIAIGTSSNSASPSADLCRADGQNSIAIGSAARADASGAISIGDDTRALTTSTTAIGDGAQVILAATGSTAIGAGATASLPNTTVLGMGTAHRVFSGSRELATSINESGDANSISCTVNNDFYQEPNNGFNPSITRDEILRYTQVGSLAIGRFDYRLALNETSAFQEGDRWTVNSESNDMQDAFGYAVGTSAIPLGTFVISGNAYNSAAMGDFWLHPSSTETIVRLSFRIRSSIGTPPSRDSYVSAHFSISKF